MNSIKVRPNQVIFFIIIILHLSFLPFLFAKEAVYLNPLLAVIIIASSLYFLFQLLSRKHRSGEYLDKWDLLFLALLLAIPSIISMVHINDYSIWLDESEEGHNVLAFKDIILQASYFQQPPIAYFIRKLGLLIVGVTETGLRISSVFGNTLFLVVMYLNLKKLTKNSLYSFLGVLLLGLNTWLIVYSVEARPYSISLFYFSVFCYFIMDDILGLPQLPQGKLNLNLAFATFFWLMSISMQPIIFIGTILSCLILKYINDKDFRYLKLFLSISLGLLLFIPFLNLILINSERYVKKAITFDTSFLLAIGQNEKIVAQMLFQNIYYEIMTAGFIVTIILALMFARQRKILYQFLILSFGYLAALIFLFTIKINWGLSTRYLLTFIPLFYLLFLGSLFYGAENRKPLHRSFALLLFVALALFSYIQFKPMKPIRKDWRGLYTSFEQMTPNSGDAYIFSFHHAGTWLDEYFIAKDFYPSSKVKFLAINDFSFPMYTNNDYLLSQFDKKPAVDSHYFTILNYTLSRRDFDAIEIPNAVKSIFEDFYLISIQDGVSLHDFSKNFFVQLDKNVTNKSRIINIKDGLFLISMYEKNCEDAQKYLIDFEEAAKPFNKEYQGRLERHKDQFGKLCNSVARVFP